MEPKAALNLMGQVAAQHRGTLQDHQQIQQAMQTLAEIVNAIPEPAKDAKK